MKLSPQEFIDEWNKSNGPSDMAHRFGMKLGAVQMRATRYRRRGYQLRFFKIVPGHEPEMNKLPVRQLEN